VDAVGAIDVRVAARQEHRPVARAAAAEIAVAGRFLVVVRLDLHDHAADAVDVQLGADELRGDLEHGAREVHGFRES